MSTGRPAPGMNPRLAYEAFAVKIIFPPHFMNRFGADIFFESQAKPVIVHANKCAQNLDFHALEYPGFALADVGLADHPCTGL